MRVPAVGASPPLTPAFSPRGARETTEAVAVPSRKKPTVESLVEEGEDGGEVGKDVPHALLIHILAPMPLMGEDSEG